MEKAGAAIRSLWIGRCTVYHDVKRINPDTKRTEVVETVLYENLSCRLSYSSLAATGEKDHAATLAQVVKLFLSPDWDIPPGCRITVMQHGIKNEFRNSGEAARHTNHQEIVLLPKGRWA